MRFTKLITLFFCLLFFSAAGLWSQNAWAYPCGSLDNNSCWHVKNLGNEQASITCGMVLDQNFSRELKPGQFDSYQFPGWYHDGMGYPATPNDGAICTVEIEQQKITVKFPVYVGSRVKAEILADRSIKVTTKSYWGAVVEREYFSGTEL